jgi:hypothetical protein
LQAAAQRDLVDFPSAVAALLATNFYVSNDIVDRALQDEAQRRRQKPHV